MTKRKSLQPVQKPRGAAPTRTVKKLRAGDVVFLPSDTARLLESTPLASRIPTKKKDLRILKLEVTSGAAKGKQVEFVAALDDRMEIKTTPFINRVVAWFRKLRKWRPFG